MPIQILELKAGFKCENAEYYQDANLTVSDYFYVLPNKELKKFNSTQIYDDKPLIIKYSSLFKFKPLITVDHFCGINFENRKKDCIMRSTMHLSFDNDEPMDQVNEQAIVIQLARAGKRKIVCGADREE
uniref:ZP domain-containing protein n=1 Tax=Panagrellus redivivus TaxID=6233 RepID=A0A7E4UXS1_PANRE